MRVKARDDPNLIDKEYIQTEVTKLEDFYIQFKAKVDLRLAEARSQELENKSKDNQIVKIFERFYSSEIPNDRKISNLNHMMILSEKSMR